MTRQEILDRIEHMRRELDLLRSVLTPPKKRPRAKKDYTRQIQKSIIKTRMV